MDVLDKVRRLSKPQLKALDLHLGRKSMSSTATGARMNIEKNSLGGVLSSLYRNGLIEPAGLEEGKRTLQWTLAPEVEKKKDEVSELVDRILNLYKTK